MHFTIGMTTNELDRLWDEMVNYLEKKTHCLNLKEKKDKEEAIITLARETGSETKIKAALTAISCSEQLTLNMND